FDARIRVGKLAAARQFDEQVGAGTLEQKSAAANYLLTVAYCFPGCTIDRIPELPNIGMRGAPSLLEPLDLFVGEPIRLEFAPSVTAALIAEGEVTGFANFSFRRFLVEAAVGDPKYFACGDAIRLVARILRGIEAAIGIQLPVFAGDPSQYTAFDRAE